jgi:hypothetical protein
MTCSSESSLAVCTNSILSSLLRWISAAGSIGHAARFPCHLSQTPHTCLAQPFPNELFLQLLYPTRAAALMHHRPADACYLLADERAAVHDACYLLACCLPCCCLRAFVILYQWVSHRVSMYVHYCIHCIALMLLTLILSHYFFNFMPDSGGSHYVYVYTTENTEYIVQYMCLSGCNGIYQTYT